MGKMKALLFMQFLKDKDRAGTLEGMILSLFWIAYSCLHFPLGFSLSWANFTYGAKGPDPTARAQLPFLFLGWLLTISVWEILFRGFLLRFLLKKHSASKAVLIHLFFINCGVAMALLDKALKWESLGIFRFFLLENLLESFLALFFLRTGSLRAVIFLHASINFIRFVMISDVTGPFETFYFYSAATDLFYGLILGTFFLALLIQGGVNAKFGIREKAV